MSDEADGFPLTMRDDLASVPQGSYAPNSSMFRHNTFGTLLPVNRQGDGRRLRLMVLQALDNCGGVLYLQKIAENDPRAFCALVARILPRDIEVSNDSSWRELLEQVLAKKSLPAPEPPDGEPAR